MLGYYLAHHWDQAMSVRPTPHPCSACGVLIVESFGTFDADAFSGGVSRRHLCPIEDIAPLNEREYEALLAQVDPPPLPEKRKPKDLVKEAPATQPRKFTR